MKDIKNVQMIPNSITNNAQIRQKKTIKIKKN